MLQKQPQTICLKDIVSSCHMQVQHCAYKFENGSRVHGHASMIFHYYVAATKSPLGPCFKLKDSLASILDKLRHNVFRGLMDWTHGLAD